MESIEQRQSDHIDDATSSENSGDVSVGLESFVDEDSNRLESLAADDVVDSNGCELKRRP